jgi:hypothetical protein
VLGRRCTRRREGKGRKGGKEGWGGRICTASSTDACFACDAVVCSGVAALLLAEPALGHRFLLLHVMLCSLVGSVTVLASSAISHFISRLKAHPEVRDGNQKGQAERAVSKTQHQKTKQTNIIREGATGWHSKQSNAHIPSIPFIPLSTLCRCSCHQSFECDTPFLPLPLRAQVLTSPVPYLILPILISTAVFQLRGTPLSPAPVLTSPLSHPQRVTPPPIPPSPRAQVLTSPVPYLILPILISTAVFQLKHLNLAQKHFDSNQAREALASATGLLPVQAAGRARCGPNATSRTPHPSAPTPLAQASQFSSEAFRLKSGARATGQSSV